MATDDADMLHLSCRLPQGTMAGLETGTYFLRFRTSGNILTVPPDDRLRLRVK